jgi:hypothetical protein
MVAAGDAFDPLHLVRPLPTKISVDSRNCSTEFSAPRHLARRRPGRTYAPFPSSGRVPPDLHDLQPESPRVEAESERIQAISERVEAISVPAVPELHPAAPISDRVVPDSIRVAPILVRLEPEPGPKQPIPVELVPVPVDTRSDSGRTSSDSGSAESVSGRTRSDSASFRSDIASTRPNCGEFDPAPVNSTRFRVSSSRSGAPDRRIPHAFQAYRSTPTTFRNRRVRTESGLKELCPELN